MSKICTDINQSKKLLELGIDIHTADLTVTSLPVKGEERFDFICVKLPGDTFPSITDGKSEKIPAWSLTALMKLIPPGNILLRDALNGKYKCINTVDSDYYDNPVDAAFETVVWLKQNGKL